MTTPPYIPPSRPTLPTVLKWTLPCATAVAVAALLRTPAPAPAPQAPPPAPLSRVLVAYSDRPWVRSGNDAFFDFTDDEWRTLTNAYPERYIEATATNEASIYMPQGEIMRAHEARLKAIAEMRGSVWNTNAVWFCR